MERRKLCVELSDFSVLSKLPSSSNVVYKSKKYNYAIVFTNNSDFDYTLNVLKGNNQVTEIMIEDINFKF